MKLLFAVQGTTGKEKVSDSDIQQHYPSINSNMLWKEIEPYVRQATQKEIIKYIGQPFYDHLATKFHANDLSDDYKVIVGYLKDAIANFTVAMALPRKKTMLSSMGAIENNATDSSTQTSLWGFRSTLFTSYQDAGIFLDLALERLEILSKETGNQYDLWKNDASYNAGATDFFRTTGEFMQYAPINQSRRTFLAMRTLIQAQSKVVVSVLCKGQFDSVKSAVTAQNPSEPLKILLDAVRRFVANGAVAAAADAIPVLPETDGFRIMTAVDSLDTRNQAVETIRNAVQAIKDFYADSAKTALADLISLLYSNPDDYPDWRDSPCNRSNDGEKITCVGDGAVML